jgi:hypothetical protein
VGKEHCVQVFAERPDVTAEREAFVAVTGLFREYPQALVVHCTSISVAKRRAHRLSRADVVN